MTRGTSKGEIEDGLASFGSIGYLMPADYKKKTEQA
jgi:hypothetical protein